MTTLQFVKDMMWLNKHIKEHPLYERNLLVPFAKLSKSVCICGIKIVEVNSSNDYILCAECANNDWTECVIVCKKYTNKYELVNYCELCLIKKCRQCCL